MGRKGLPGGNSCLETGRRGIIHPHMNAADAACIVFGPNSRCGCLVFSLHPPTGLSKKDGDKLEEIKLPTCLFQKNKKTKPQLNKSVRTELGLHNVY